jgi:serine/threonine protein kinase
MNLLKEMLKKNPLERITADDAIKHPYFTIGSMADEDSFEEAADKVDINGCIDSPLLTTSNAKRKADKSMKKDSCIDFKMGK